MNTQERNGPTSDQELQLRRIPMEFDFSPETSNDQVRDTALRILDASYEGTIHPVFLVSRFSDVHNPNSVMLSALVTKEKRDERPDEELAPHELETRRLKHLHFRQAWI